MENILSLAKNHQIKLLQETLEKLNKLNEPSEQKTISFSIKDILDDSGIEKLAKQLPKSWKFIYFFTSLEYHNIPNLFRSNHNKEIKFTKLNKNEVSENLYVGSSSSLRNRFKQHCGKWYKGTYAIKFRAWLTNSNIKIDFHYFKIEASDQDVLQNIEDGLWDIMRPIFGKKWKQ